MAYTAAQLDSNAMKKVLLLNTMTALLLYEQIKYIDTGKYATKAIPETHHLDQLKHTTQYYAHYKQLLNKKIRSSEEKVGTNPGTSWDEGTVHYTIELKQCTGEPRKDSGHLHTTQRVGTPSLQSVQATTSCKLVLSQEIALHFENQKVFELSSVCQKSLVQNKKKTFSLNKFSLEIDSSDLTCIINKKKIYN